MSTKTGMHIFELAKDTQALARLAMRAQLTLAEQKVQTHLKAT